MRNNSVKIRPADRNDVNRIVLIAAQVSEMIQKKRARLFGGLREFKKDKNFYLKQLRKKDRIIYVAVMNDRIMGYAYAVIERKPDDLISIPYVSFDELAIDKRYRGLGIGSKLIDTVQRWASHKKVKAIQLGVWEFNEDTIKLYERFGYKTIMRKMEKVLRKRQ